MSTVEYEPNPKHREPWQRGKRGSLCPTGLDTALLLNLSVQHPSNANKRFTTDGCRAYCGHQHAPGLWHGYPEAWRQVPESLWRQWVSDGVVTKRCLKEHW